MKRRISITAVLCLSLLTVARTADCDSFDSDGVEIFYSVRGKGEPVVLVHGYMASAALNWALPGVTKHLAKDYMVVSLDLRGHGLSGKPEKPEDYGVKMVEDVVRLMDRLKIEKAHIVGYSMGGMIAMKMATLHPKRMKSAVIGGMGWVRPRKQEGKAFSSIRKGATTSPLRACAASLLDLGISKEELEGIKLPMTVIVGTDDGMLKSRVEPMMAVRPDIPVVKIPDADHRSCIFKPEFREAIAEFLERQP